MTWLRLRDRLPTTYLVHPAVHKVFKVMPNSPPERGETVLVDGERCRVVSCRVDWRGRDWRIRRMKVRKLG